jgi:hypothetical protein
MNFIYRNNLDQTVRFTLGGGQNLIHYSISPGETVEIPEKWDYAIEAMGVRLDKDYELSMVCDARKNPEVWDNFVKAPECSAPECSDVQESKINDAERSTPKSRAIRARKTRSAKHSITEK